MIGNEGWIIGLASGLFSEQPRYHIDRHSNRLGMAAAIAAHAITPGNRIIQPGRKEGATRLLKASDLANQSIYDGRALTRAMEKEASRSLHHEPIGQMARRIAADWDLQHSALMEIKPETLEADSDHILMEIAIKDGNPARSNAAKCALGMYSEITSLVNRLWAMEYTFNKIMGHEVIANRIDRFENGIDEIILAFDPFEIQVDVGLPINATCRLAKRTHIAQAGGFAEAGFSEACSKAFRATRSIMVNKGIDEFDMRYIQALIIVLMDRNKEMTQLSASRISVIILSIANMIKDAREAQKSSDPEIVKQGQDLEMTLTSCDIDHLKISQIRTIYRCLSETRNVSMQQGMLLVEALAQAEQDWEIAHMPQEPHIKLISSN